MAERLRGSQPARSRTIFSLLMKKAAVFKKASHSLLGKSAGTLSGSWCSWFQEENLMCKLFQPSRTLNGSHLAFWSTAGSFLGTYSQTSVGAHDHSAVFNHSWNEHFLRRERGSSKVLWDVHWAQHWIVLFLLLVLCSAACYTTFISALSFHSGNGEQHLSNVL